MFFSLKKNHLLSLLLLFVTALPLSAQDYTSVEAYINDHKVQRDLLIGRTILEEGNSLLHKEHRNATQRYRDINNALDKYRRAFDIINAITSTIRVGINVYQTYNTVRDRISDITALLEEYNEKCLSRLDIEEEDVNLIRYFRESVSGIGREIEQIYNSVIFISGCATARLSMTTNDYTMMVNRINQSLINIRTIVNEAYFNIFTYIKIRTTFWKKELFSRKTKREISNEAFQRWHDRYINSLPTHNP